MSQKLDALTFVVADEPDAEAVLSEHFTFTPTGLLITGQPSQTAFDACGAFLSTELDKLRWLIADWAITYADTFGHEAYEIAVQQAGLNRTASTIETWASVARRVPYRNRRADLCYSFHVVVAPLALADQVEALHWLILTERATGKMPSVSQFAAYVAQHYHQQSPPPTFPDDIKEQLTQELYKAEIQLQEQRQVAAAAVTETDRLRSALLAVWRATVMV